MKKWKVWKTIRMGTGLKTAADFRKVLRGKKIELDEYNRPNWGHALLHHPSFTIAPKETEVDLVKVEVGELCFYDRDEYGVILSKYVYPRAIASGLELCPSEVGPQLCIQHTRVGWVVIGMKPVTIPYSERHSIDNWSVNVVFQLNACGGRSILQGCGHSSSPNTNIYTEEWVPFIFVLPRTQNRQA